MPECSGTEGDEPEAASTLMIEKKVYVCTCRCVPVPVLCMCLEAEDNPTCYSQEC